MATWHETGAEALLDDMLFDREAAAVLAETRADLRDGKRFSEPYVAAIGQTREKAGSWSPSQAAAFLTVHAGIMSGEFGHVVISVGGTPGPDADRVGNTAKLADVHPPFRAELDMDQNNADCDGSLLWPEPIVVERSTGVALLAECPADRPGPVMIYHRVPAGSAPLEVGSTLPSRTYLHLIREGGVARWPYGSDLIHLFVNHAIADRRWQRHGLASAQQDRD